MEDKRISKKERITLTLKWLWLSFPKAFSPKEIRLLKKGILEDIFKKLPESKLISRNMVRRAVNRYTRDARYHRALIDQTYRVDLLGEVVEEITEDEKQYAKSFLHLSAKKQRFSQENIRV